MLMNIREESHKSILPDGSTLETSLVGEVRLEMEADGAWTEVTVTGVHYSPSLPCNLLSYGALEQKGCVLSYAGSARYLTVGKSRLARVEMENNVLVIKTQPTANLVSQVLSAITEHSENPPHEDTLMNFSQLLLIF